MATELKITKERILLAAKDSCQAEQLLRGLFPEAFTPTMIEEWNKGNLVWIGTDKNALHLNSNFEWSLNCCGDGRMKLVASVK